MYLNIIDVLLNLPNCSSYEIFSVCSTVTNISTTTIINNTYLSGFVKTMQNF